MEKAIAAARARWAHGVQGLRHGPGTYTFANGNGIRDKGSGVFWLAVGEFVTCR